MLVHTHGLCFVFLLQTVFENSLMTQKLCAPPKAMGKITYLAPPGQYTLKVRRSIIMHCGCILLISC